MLKRIHLENLSRAWMLAGVSLAFLLSAGCGSGEDKGPTGTVEGTVTYQGEPLSEGFVVSFISSEGSGAGGETGSDGSFTLRSEGSDQIPVGTYKVSISPPSSDLSPEEAMEKSMKGESPELPQAEYPEKYLNPSTSGLSFEVKEGENDFQVELKDE